MNYSVAFFWHSFAILCVGLVIFQSLESVEAEDVAKSIQHQVAEANDEFGRLLLQQLEQEKPGQNVLISPFSLSSAISMLLAGSAGKTFDEIYSTLGLSKYRFSSNSSDIYQAYHQLTEQATHRGQSSKSATLNIVNAIAVQKGAEILQSYLQLIDAYFGAQLFEENFQEENARKKAVKELNGWVAEKTQGKISELIPSLEQDTMLVLLNAIYFKGEWQQRFLENQTKNEPFHLGGQEDQTVSVPLMSINGVFNYNQFSDGQLVELPYRNGALSMFVFLPSDSSSKSHPTISSQLESHSLAKRISACEKRNVSIFLPRFKLEGSYDLKDSLERMGIKAAFKGGDFSKQTVRHNLVVSKVLQKTAIEVNEHGSEAAAATAVVEDTESKPRVWTFRADKKFAYFIRDNQSQLTLFSGIFNKP